MLKKRSFGILLLTAALMLTCFSGSIVAAAEETGAEFTYDKAYITEEAPSQLPAAFEATVNFPTDTPADQRGGVILGSYYDAKTQCVNFEIHQKGNPRLFLIDDEGNSHDFIFDQVNVYLGAWTHIAVVMDETQNAVSCYVNGKLRQTIETDALPQVTLSGKMAIGGDLRMANGQYFKGSLKDVTIYSDARTADEVLSDSQGAAPDTDSLMGSYDLTGMPQTLSDKGGIGPDFNLTDIKIWLEDYESVTDYAYSFAVLGDIQSLTCFYPDKLHYIYDWIIENAEEKKMKFVFGLGDITDDNTDTEWKLAKSLMAGMDNVVPYSVIRGNHDSMSQFTKYFPIGEFGDTVDGSYDGSTMLNTYKKLTVGNIKYLIINLDLGPSDAVLEWASQLIQEHSDYNVIITTHIYLYSDGTTVDSMDSSPATKYGGINNGDSMWDKLIKKHENIVLVLSGHIPTDRIIVTQSQGDNGNTVTQMLIDPQSTDKTYEGAGLVTMLYFSEDGSQVDVEYYSTIKDAHYMAENQFHLELDVVEAQPAEEPEPAVFPWQIALILAAVVVVAAVVVILIVVKKKKQKSE